MIGLLNWTLDLSQKAEKDGLFNWTWKKLKAERGQGKLPEILSSLSNKHGRNLVCRRGLWSEWDDLSLRAWW